MNIRHRDKKVGYRMPKNVRSSLIGMILGDANINKRGKNHRLLLKHGGSQLFYLEWKRNLLNSITGMPVHIFRQKVKSKFYTFGQFATLTHREFTDLYHLFYSNGRKLVPKNIAGLLSARSLATWFMDDGAKDGAGVTFQTHSFQLSDLQRLIDALRMKFNIRATKRKNKSHYVLYIPKDYIKRLWHVTRSYILPEFRYKFPSIP